MRAFHKPARVTLPNGRQVDLRVALFDTGADRDNYISTRCVKDNCLEEFLTPVSNKVKVASGVVVPIESKLEVDLTFLDHCGDSHTASVIFMVLEGLGKDLVIGQPTITLHFFEIFQELLMDARDLAQKIKGKGAADAHIMEDVKERYAGSMKPWTCAPDSVAPEEDEIPEFGFFNFMEV
jgi:hypothetical protein